VVEPRELRNTVVFPVLVADPVVEPRESRNTVVFPVRVAVPTVEPRESRNVVCWAAAGTESATSVAVIIRKRFIVVVPWFGAAAARWSSSALRYSSRIPFTGFSVS
jgi:hypothetical protein